MNNFAKKMEEIDSGATWERYIINDRSPSIVYAPIDDPLVEENVGWFHANLGKHGVGHSYETDNHRTKVEGATAALEFTASQIKVFVQGIPQGGLAEIRLDGNKVAVMDTYAPKRTDYMLGFEIYELSADTHTLEIEVLDLNSRGEQLGNWVHLDFLDTSEMPVFRPFLPQHIEADFTAMTVNAHVASWGKGGRAGLWEAGFVLSWSGNPTIRDRKVPGTVEDDGRVVANIVGLSSDTEYRIRPYVVIGGKVYYGRHAKKATKSRIDLSMHVVAVWVGGTLTITVDKLHGIEGGVACRVIRESRYDGRGDRIVDVQMNSAGNEISIMGIAEGEAVVVVASDRNSSVCMEIQVTVARKGKVEGLANTPPMGWNTWNSFGRVVTAELVRKIIDALCTPFTENGKSLRDLGYEYVVVDGGWRQNWLEPDGTVVPNRYFGGPEGMKELADYAHSKGLKFGLHVLPGIMDCVKQYVGAFGYERRHLEQYKEWGVDYLKMDRCGGYTTPENMYKRIKYYMDNAGKDFLFSISNYYFFGWEAEIGHMWRTTFDIHNIANHAGGASWDNYMDFARKNTRSWKAAGPGGWNDPDCMVVGDPGLTLTESVSNFNVWAMMAAPLIFGLNLLDMENNRDALRVLSNDEVIAVNQDSLGKHGRPVVVTGGLEVWAKPLADGSMAVLLLNDTTAATDITVHWREVVYNTEYKLEAGEYEVRDLWLHENLGAYADLYTATDVPSHGTVLLKVSRGA